MLLLPVLAGPLAAQRFEVPEGQGLRYFKGNTHTHTLESDGDSPPEVVVRWYRDHGYQFLVLSDHNVFTDPKRLAGLVDTSFILIGGEELTSAFRNRPVHVNGLNLSAVVAPRRDSTLIGTIQRNVDAVREVRGTPHINHPNFGWAFSTRELLQIRNDPLIEIWNGHPTVHNEGGDDSPGLEEVWDELLTAGKRIYGIAVDDAHHFQGEFAANRANPGRGWIAIQAERLDPALLMTGLERGRFYASSGVALERVTVEPNRLAISIAADRDFKFTTTFIGDSGRVLAVRGGRNPEFRLSPAEAARLRYVRARVTDSGGRHAWIQPVFVLR
ncbi:MAG: CehA/McbA family metallohydrolase [Gemmatimonadales bacterium]